MLVPHGIWPKETPLNIFDFISSKGSSLHDEICLDSIAVSLFSNSETAAATP